MGRGYAGGAQTDTREHEWVAQGRPEGVSKHGATDSHRADSGGRIQVLGRGATLPPPRPMRCDELPVDIGKLLTAPPIALEDEWVDDWDETGRGRDVLSTIRPVAWTAQESEGAKGRRAWARAAWMVGAVGLVGIGAAFAAVELRQTARLDAFAAGWVPESGALKWDQGLGMRPTRTLEAEQLPLVKQERSTVRTAAVVGRGADPSQRATALQQGQDRTKAAGLSVGAGETVSGDPADRAEAPTLRTESALGRGLTAFDPAAAQKALATAAVAASACRHTAEGDVARVTLTFAPTGRVTTATVNGRGYAGTAEGGCIARVFRSAQVAPYDGGLVTVHRSVRLQ